MDSGDRKAVQMLQRIYYFIATFIGAGILWFGIALWAQTYADAQIIADHSGEELVVTNAQGKEVEAGGLSWEDGPELNPEDIISIAAPSYMLHFQDGGLNEVGHLSWEDGQFRFHGNAHVSAHIFINALNDVCDEERMMPKVDGFETKETLERMKVSLDDYDEDTPKGRNFYDLIAVIFDLDERLRALEGKSPGGAREDM